jgi:hypothetical protein
MFRACFTASWLTSQLNLQCFSIFILNGQPEFDKFAYLVFDLDMSDSPKSSRWRRTWFSGSMTICKSSREMNSSQDSVADH